MGKLDERVVLSHADAGCFFRKMNLCCEVIYNPLTVLPKGRGKKEYRRILAVGRFSFGHKGFDILIKAFSVFVKLIRTGHWKLWGRVLRKRFTVH